MNIDELGDISFHTEPSAVATNPSTAPSRSSTELRFVDRYVVPDFVFFEYVWQAPTGRCNRKIILVIEIKRLHRSLCFLPRQPDLFTKRLDELMEEVINGQIWEQVQHAFLEFPHQDKMYAMCIFGEYWKLVGFKRTHTANNATQNKNELPTIVKTMETSIYRILREDNDDFHTQFKRRFTEVTNIMSRV